MLTQRELRRTTPAVALSAYLSPPLHRSECIDGQLTGRLGYRLFGPDAGIVARLLGLPEDRRYQGGWKVWPEEVERAVEVGAVQLTYLEYRQRVSQEAK